MSLDLLITVSTGETLDEARPQHWQGAAFTGAGVTVSVWTGAPPLL